MLTEKELEAAIKRITGRIDEVNRLYVKKIAAQLLKIGELNASSVNRIVIMTEMGKDVREITRELAQATAMNIRDMPCLKSILGSRRVLIRRINISMPPAISLQTATKHI